MNACQAVFFKEIVFVSGLLSKNIKVSDCVLEIDKSMNEVTLYFSSEKTKKSFFCSNLQGYSCKSQNLDSYTDAIVFGLKNESFRIQGFTLA